MGGGAHALKRVPRIKFPKRHPSSSSSSSGNYASSNSSHFIFLPNSLRTSSFQYSLPNPHCSNSNCHFVGSWRVSIWNNDLVFSSHSFRINNILASNFNWCLNLDAVLILLLLCKYSVSFLVIMDKHETWFCNKISGQLHFFKIFCDAMLVSLLLDLWWFDSVFFGDHLPSRFVLQWFLLVCLAILSH